MKVIQVKRTPLAIALIVVAALAVSACTSAIDVPDPNSTTGEWRLIGGTDADGAAIKVAYPAPTVVIVDREPLLFQACEYTPQPSYRQNYECAENDASEKVADAVAASSTVARDGAALVLTGDDPDLRLQFYPVEAVTTSDLVGSWTSTLPSSLQFAPTSFVIDADRSLSGTIGCLTVTGRAVDNDADVAQLEDIDLEDLTAAEDYCPQEQSAQLASDIRSPAVFHLDEYERLVVLAASGRSYDFVRTGALELRDLDGDWYLTFGEDSTGQFSTDIGLRLSVSVDEISGGSSCETFVALTSDQRKEARESVQNLIPIQARSTATVRGCADTGPLLLRYTEAVAAVTSGVLDGKALVLSGDGVDLRFERAERTK